MMGKRWGTPWTSRQFIMGLIHRDKQPLNYGWTHRGERTNSVHEVWTRNFLVARLATVPTTAPPCHWGWNDGNVIHFVGIGLWQKRKLKNSTWWWHWMESEAILNVYTTFPANPSHLCWDISARTKILDQTEGTINAITRAMAKTAPSDRV